jgi:hypothetical protein
MQLLSTAPNLPTVVLGIEIGLWLFQKGYQQQQLRHSYFCKHSDDKKNMKEDEKQIGIRRT